MVEAFMDRDDHQRMHEFEWMRARVGAGAGPGETRGDSSRLVAELEELQAENERLRKSVERAKPLEDRPAVGRGRSTRTPTLAEVERDHILKVLLDCHWRVKGPEAAADLLGLNPGTLYSRMKKLGIHKDEAK
jgi:transcriptional regulator with GAF, ATPase, and Fis domain